jgi:hypothetical protein
MEKEIHAFEATRIAKENARLGMFYAEIVGSPIVSLNDLELGICIKRLTALSYKVEQITTGLIIKWEE